ncbi:MAG: ECF subfamily RNA polymerase sigma-24 [Planctomycetota bacterium]|nr:MAG: ECF subfamily RNA polymerase sigma-24 [Planctomycetota bacterium]
MSRRDPLTGPGPVGFRPTAWSLILSARTLSPQRRSRALGQLISVYWLPVYWTFRTDWNAGPEEARDLTQEYFAVFLEKKLLDQVAREKGRFRSYVRATLKNFMLMRKRARKTAKRGGRVHIGPLDDLAGVEAQAVRSGESPERRFDRDLMRSVFQESMKKVEQDCALAGNSAHFDLFRAYYILEDAAGAGYESLQERFGLGAHDVKNRLSSMRKRFRETVLGFLRDGTSSEEELVAEIQELFET